MCYDTPVCAQPIKDGGSSVMSNYRNSKITKLLNILNVALITLPFALSWLFYYTHRISVRYFYKGNTLIIVLSAIFYVVFCRIYEGFDAYLMRKYEVVYSQGLAAFISDFFMYIICWLLKKNPLPAVWPIAAALSRRRR